MCGVALLATAPPSPAPSASPVFRLDNARFRADTDVTTAFLPTPSPAVLASTKFIYEENVLAQKHWGPLPFAPEERYVRVYVSSITRFGPFRICHGWSVRVPMEGAPIVDAHDVGMCAGKLQPFDGGTPPPVPKSALPQ
jgi:hypothetical protein